MYTENKNNIPNIVFNENVHERGSQNNAQYTAAIILEWNILIFPENRGHFCANIYYYSILK